MGDTGYEQTVSLWIDWAMVANNNFMDILIYEKEHINVDSGEHSGARINCAVEQLCSALIFPFANDR